MSFVLPFQPYNWLKDAKIYNKLFLRVSQQWIADNSDCIVLLFTTRGLDKKGLIQKFYGIYEYYKYLNLPVEVIYVPLDEAELDMIYCFEKQANWFTFKRGDPMIHELVYLYQVTCMPHITVVRPDGAMVSRHGLDDLETYGKNALITWLTTTALVKIQRRLSCEKKVYAGRWRYLDPNTGKTEYKKRFIKSISMMPGEGFSNFEVQNE